MSKTTFKDDTAARNVIRLLLVLQATALLSVIGLGLLGRIFPALVISFLTLLSLAGALAWLYLRYRRLPALREKDELERLWLRFSTRLQKEKSMLQAAFDERDELDRLEKEEIELLPPAHPAGQLESIRQKYRLRRERNAEAERKALASQLLLEHELTAFKPRLRELAPLTFLGYLSQALSPGRLAAPALAVALLLAQLISSVSATGFAVRAVLLPARTVATGVEFYPSPGLTSTEIASPTPAPTTTPAASETALPTASATVSPTTTPQATLPAGIAACIPQDSPRQTALVLDVTDGDTIQVSIDGQAFAVRYIGIDAPEQGQLLYAEAQAYNRQLVHNQVVTLVQDISATDRFDRLLRYVIVGDTFVNQRLVEQGYAGATAYAPDTACVSAFETAQGFARSTALGLWMPTQQAFVPPVTGGDAEAGCDPAYPGVCIPPPPPDLDCGDISFRRFQVLPPDPHRFDRDADGVGCEG